MQVSAVKQRTLQLYQHHFTGLQSALSNQSKKKAQANITADTCTILPSANSGIYIYGILIKLNHLSLSLLSLQSSELMENGPS